MGRTKLAACVFILCQNAAQEQSHAKGILSACEKTPRKQESVNCSWNVLLCPSQVQRIHVSFLRIIPLQLAIIMCLCALGEKHLLRAVCPCDYIPEKTGGLYSGDLS